MSTTGSSNCVATKDDECWASGIAFLASFLRLIDATRGTVGDEKMDLAEHTIILESELEFMNSGTLG